MVLLQHRGLEQCFLLLLFFCLKVGLSRTTVSTPCMNHLIRGKGRAARCLLLTTRRAKKTYWCWPFLSSLPSKFHEPDSFLFDLSEGTPSSTTGQEINQYVRFPGNPNALDHVPLKYLRAMQDCCSHEPNQRPDASTLSHMKYGPYLILPKSVILQLAMQGDVAIREKLVSGTVPGVNPATRAKGQVILESAIKYFYGKGVPKNARKAIEICKRAVDIGCEDGPMLF